MAPRAERDLEEIADFYAVQRNNQAAARRVLEAIRTSCRRAGQDPQLGRRREDLGSYVRSKVVLEYPYVIYFRPAPSGMTACVQVIRILHQRRDVETAITAD